MKKFIANIMALALILSLAGCAKATKGDGSKTSSGKHEYTDEYDETKYNAPGEFPIFKEKQTITVQVPDSSYIEDFNTNTQTLLMEEELNADLQIEALPSKEYKTKLNLMVAAGGDEFADAVLGKLSDAEVLNFSSNDVIVPLTKYFYNTSIAYYLNVANNETIPDVDLFAQVTMPDGEIYGIPAYNDSVSNINPDKMYVYEPWVEQLGMKLEDIKTTEDFKNLLIKFRDSDLNGNGKKDEIPNIQSTTNNSWFNYMMNPFVYAGDENYMVVEDGEISLAYTKDEWKDGLKYMKDLYDEGLISPLTMSQDSAAMKSVVNSKETVVGTFATLGSGSVDGDRRYEYIAISPLEGSNGTSYGSYTPTTATVRFAVSKNAKDVENTFRFGDLMTSKELSIMTRWGEKGVDWKEASATDKSDYDSLGYKATIIPILEWSTLQNKHWCQTGPHIRDKSISAGVVSEGDNSQSGARSQLAYEGHNPEEYITKLIYTAEESEEVTDKLAALLEYVDEMSVSFVTGDKDIDNDWDDFQNQIEAIGSESVVQVAQAAFDRMGK